jgi:hypothetical protein
MNSLTVELFKARDAEDSFALLRAGDPKGSWRAVTGFGSDFGREWSVELQSHDLPEQNEVDWNSVLERVIEAAEMSDPVITEYQWPRKSAAPAADKIA